MLDEKVASAAVCSLKEPSHGQVQCYSPLRQQYSDFGVFSNGVAYVIKITVAESNPHVGLLTQEAFCFLAPSVLVRDNIGIDNVYGRSSEPIL